MKRQLFSDFRFVLALIVLCSLVLPIISMQSVSAFTGSYTKMQSITITDNGSVARAGVPVILSSINGTNYYVSGYINVNGTNTAMTDNSTAADVSFMMDTTQAACVIPNLPAYGSQTYNLLMGTSANQTNFPIITGTGGYLTTPDAPAIELGNNFTIEQSGYWDTSYAVGKNAVYKQDAFRTYVSSAGNITSELTSSVLSWAYPTGNTANGWNNPTYAYDNNTVTFADYTVSFTWSPFLEFSYASCLVDAIKFYCSGSDPDIDQIDIDVYYSGGYQHLYSGAFTQDAWIIKAIGSFQTSTGFRVSLHSNGNLKSAWIMEVQYEKKTDTNVSVTAPVSSGFHIVTTSANITHLAIAVDGISITSTTLSGSSVYDNNIIWYWSQNDTMPYVSYIEERVNGVDVLKYQPTAMLNGTTLPDMVGTNTATIVWGANSNLVITYGSVINAPSVQTNDASGVAATSAYAYGAVTGLGSNTYVNVGFEYGQDIGYGLGSTPQIQMTSVGAFYYQLTGLYPNTAYHFRAFMVYGANNKIYGADKTFTTLPALGSSTTIQIRNAKVFSGYMSSNNSDILLVVETLNNYTNIYPNESPREHFTIQLLAMDNTAILGAAPLASWGDRPSSIYFNPTIASNLTYGSAYYVRMIGDSKSGYATTEYQLIPSSSDNTDWKGSDLTKLDYWCRGVAINMQIADSRNDYLVDVADRNSMINDPASSYFTMGIPAITQIRPNLFTTTKQTPQQPTGPAGSVWDSLTAWTGNVGPIISGDATIMAAPFGLNGKDFLAGVIMLSILGIIISVAAFGALGGLLISLPIIWVGSWFKILPIILLILLILFFGFMFIRQFFIKTT